MFPLLLSLTALAGNPMQPGERERPETPEALIEDLIDGRPPEQLYAARELKRLAKVGLSDAAHRDPIRSMEARQYLVIFDESLAPTCTKKLEDERLMTVCADILGILETEAALPALQQALQTAEGRGKRRIEKAIRAIEES